jgi:hypothetical protein
MRTVIIDDGHLSLTVKYRTDLLDKTTISSVYDNHCHRLIGRGREIWVYAVDVINLKFDSYSNHKAANESYSNQ